MRVKLGSLYQLRSRLLLTVVLAATLISSLPLGAAPFDQYPSAIPLQYQRQAASDLVYQGAELLPDEARDLFERGVIKDLSYLNPSESSVLWKNNLAGPKTSALMLDETGEELAVIEVIPRAETLVGQFALRAFRLMENGEKKVFRVVFDPKGRNNLLRKALLEKIGYQVPRLQYVKDIQLKFRGVFSKNEAIKELARTTFLDATRWVRNGEDSESSTIEVQDVLILEDAEDEFYNLALGVIPSSQIRGRRLLNSLLVPYNLLDIPESVNLMSWIPGRVFNKQLVLDYEYGREFSTPYEDALWITRRILSLELHDWQEIIAAADYPKEVEVLVLNKVLSRLNFLRTTFKLQSQFPLIPFQSSPNHGARLKNGKLIGGVSWEGYATHFAGTDPDDPLSMTELWSFIGSKTMTNFIGTVLSEFNNRFVPKTDLGLAIFDHQLDVAAKQFVEFLKTGKVSKVPFGFWHKKFFDMNLIVNREVIAGNYMGSDNIVQLADTVGASLDLGIYLGTDGVPLPNVMIDGNAKVNFYRTYTHLRPIKSIKASLKEPLKNILVPLAKMMDARPLDELSLLASTQTNREELIKKAAALLATFKENVGIGESLIIQTGIGPDLSLLAGQGMGDYGSAYLRLQNKLTVISRLHIHRASKDLFHIYNDPALVNSFEISLNVGAHVQVLSMAKGWTKGKARTEFFNLNLELDTQAEDPFKLNPDFFDNVASLARAMKWGRLDQARSVQKPWVVEHDFSEKRFSFDFFWLRSVMGRQSDSMLITHPSGQSKKVYRHHIGKRSGLDYQSFALEAVDSLLDELTEIGDYVTLRSTNSGNPSDTFQGHSKSRVVSAEGAQDSAARPSLEDIYLSVNYRYKGWSAKPKKIKKIFNLLNNKVGHIIFPQESLYGSGKIRFYSVNMTIAFYEESIKHFLNLDRNLVSQVVRQHHRYPLAENETHDYQISRLWSKFNKIRMFYQNGRTENFVKALSELASDLENSLEFPGLATLSGGINNLYISGHLGGFRSQLENGDKDVFSHTVGMIGSESPQGPLRMIQTQSGMSEGEFLLMWLLHRY